MSIGPIVSKVQGQSQVTKGHNYQESYLSSVAQVFNVILAIEISGGIRSIVNVIFWNLDK